MFVYVCLRVRVCARARVCTYCVYYAAAARVAEKIFRVAQLLSGLIASSTTDYPYYYGNFLILANVPQTVQDEVLLLSLLG